jgi:hypothetical protein
MIFTFTFASGTGLDPGVTILPVRLGFLSLKVIVPLATPPETVIVCASDFQY